MALSVLGGLLLKLHCSKSECCVHSLCVLLFSKSTTEYEKNLPAAIFHFIKHKTTLVYLFVVAYIIATVSLYTGETLKTKKEKKIYVIWTQFWQKYGATQRVTK